ncbi:MAG: amino acid ABC transporter permease [Hyphomicrobiales bacterium]|nr:amino acid ABC transporter permease [Hyphomicrobiales bacterium]
MSKVAYVRKEMLQVRKPPVSQAGFLGWLKKNLFYSIGSSLATLLTVAVIGWLLYGLLKWLAVPTWAAQSLSDCRSIIAELARGENNAGACWGVIRDRGIQLTFGFYPPEHFWRPILAFTFLLPALAPILFAEKVPGRLIWFSALYPFLMPWLLWGGSVWVPLGVIAGFAVGYLGFRISNGLNTLFRIAICLIAALAWWIYAKEHLDTVMSSVGTIDLTPVKSRNFGGFMLSLTIGVVAIGSSLPLGILLALGRQSDLVLIKVLCVGFIEIIRGVPLITLLFVASTLLNIFLPPGTEFDIIMRVIIMATLFASAYMAEVIRGGLAALPRGQYEAAEALGLDYWKAQRLIIMPQALKVSIPGIVSTFIALFKDTTLVSVIGLLDPLGLTTAIRANQEWAGIVWELYGFIALLFMIVTFSMSRFSMYLERKLHRDH